MAEKKAQFVYVGDCKAGEVVFNENGVKTVMPKGEAVEVSDALAAKLANNSHFVRVADYKPEPEKGRKGKRD